MVVEDGRLADSARAFDCVCAAVGLVVTGPLFAIAGIAIKLTSRGPLFYRAQRVGKNGECFYVLKFRSMIHNAEGPSITAAHDPRITTVGRWLRRFKIDELPQLVNVLRGEMAVVGPRPEVAEYVGLYTTNQRRILGIRPGITSPASVCYRDEESHLVGGDWERLYVGRILPDKLDIDLRYFRQRSLQSDLAVLWRTAVSVFSRPMSTARVTV